MSDFIQAAIQASREIIEILSQRKPEYMQKHQVGAGGDVSLGADLISEATFARYLLPIANIDSEESGYMQGYGENIIILDPLDGSDNYISNIPYYGASIALCGADGTTQEAMIVNFCTKMAYYHDSQGIVCQDLMSAKISREAQENTATRCGIFEKAYSNPKLAAKLFSQKIKFRSLGASAISLAYAPYVNFMLFGGKIRKYDSQAGLFLCKNLWIKNTPDFLLVSRNKQIFDMISEIAKKD
ncbi:hypothetical protein BKH46_07025 [Helicobacter sp. 12S02634-8]|uniref:inositol monophosphatase family protein n=1 Tax=Helicobacter sp. 12S02634-8 TaxID=1476199 RepID=UPI000BA60BEE|nr:inositol monophosphatase family protein [Helicobacter sp. 12S02634-8]PAF46495.1 hypothetical protein BKH46_07025 [Helicobacter sp. 12S02634-8]